MSHDYEAIGRAVVLIASLFNGGAAPAGNASAATAAGKSKPSSGTATPASDAGQEAKASSPTQSQAAESSPSTPAQAKGDAGMSDEEFSKHGIAWAATFKDKGVTAKALLAEFSAERFSAITGDDRAKALERMEEITAEKAMA